MRWAARLTPRGRDVLAYARHRPRLSSIDPAPGQQLVAVRPTSPARPGPGCASTSTCAKNPAPAPDAGPPGAKAGPAGGAVGLMTVLRRVHRPPPRALRRVVLAVLVAIYRLHSGKPLGDVPRHVSRWNVKHRLVSGVNYRQKPEACANMTLLASGHCHELTDMKPHIAHTVLTNRQSPPANFIRP